MGPLGPPRALGDLFRPFWKNQKKVKNRAAGRPAGQGPGPGTSGQGPLGDQWTGPMGGPMDRAHGGTMGPGPRARDQGPGTRDQGPGTRDQGQGTRDQGPGTRNQGPGSKDRG